MPTCTDEAQNLLREAGWHENRRVDISGYVTLLESYGFSVFPTAQRSLERFGGIVLSQENARFKNNLLLEFGMIDAFDHAELNEFEAIEILGRDLCYVGGFIDQIGGGWPYLDIILIDTEGTFYRYVENTSLDRIGLSAEETIDNFAVDSATFFSEFYRIYPHEDYVLASILRTTNVIAILSQDHQNYSSMAKEYFEEIGIIVHLVALSRHPDKATFPGLISDLAQTLLAKHKVLPDIPEEVDTIVFPGPDIDFEDLKQRATSIGAQHIWLPSPHSSDRARARQINEQRDIPFILCEDIVESHKRLFT